jgi:hypothetical protein
MKCSWIYSTFTLIWVSKTNGKVSGIKQKIYGFRSMTLLDMNLVLWQSQFNWELDEHLHLSQMLIDVNFINP